jgi:hypothetical protein
MKVDVFDDELRRFIRARPFQPFTIVLEDGRQIEVNRPKVTFNNGGAAVVDSAGEIEFVECEQVRELRLASEELAR